VHGSTLVTSAAAAPPVGPAGLVGLNAFCRRQTPASRFSHFAGREADLVGLAEAYFPAAVPGSRDGVLKVPVPADGFFSGVIRATDRTPLAAGWVRRADGEDAYACVWAPDAAKAPAGLVDLILYRRDVLGDAKASTAAAWELVSVNARPDGGDGADEPPHPLAMARNQLGRPGGSPATYSVQEYAAAWAYWAVRLFRGPDGAEVAAGPGCPPLVAGWRPGTPTGGGPWVEAFCPAPRLLGPVPGESPGAPPPPHPAVLARRVLRQAHGEPPRTGEEFARSLHYWHTRPAAMPADAA
jgi:hypothetical protein